MASNETESVMIFFGFLLSFVIFISSDLCFQSFIVNYRFTFASLG